MLKKKVKFFCQNYKTIISKASTEVSRPEGKFVAYFSDKRGVFLVYKELLQINMKKTNHPGKKC